VLKDIRLVRYFLAQQIKYLQDEKLDEISEMVLGVASEKRSQYQKEVGHINLALQSQFLTVLAREAARGGGLKLINIDRGNSAALPGPGETDLRINDDEGEMVSREYVAKVDERGLALEWEREDAVVETNQATGQREFRKTKEVVKVYLRAGEEGIEFGRINPESGELEWTSQDAFDGAVSEMQSLFTASLEIIKPERVVRDGERRLQAARKAVEELSGISNLYELVGAFRDCEVGGYPKTELIVNSNKRVKVEAGNFGRPKGDPRQN
jgi:hypothetical protein